MNFLHLSTMAEFFGKEEAAKYFFRLYCESLWEQA
jgi:hypothetical protein